MTDWLNHLLILPILLPLAVAAVLIPIDERDRTLKGAVGFASTLVVFIVATILMRLAAAGEGSLRAAASISSATGRHHSASSSSSTACRR